MLRPLYTTDTEIRFIEMLGKNRPPVGTYRKSELTRLQKLENYRIGLRSRKSWEGICQPTVMEVLEREIAKEKGRQAKHV